jgi:hypothetical protein
MEAVFRPEIFRFFPMISDRFLTKSTGICQEFTGNKSGQFPAGILFPFPAISGVFLQDTGTFPHLSCRILREPVAGMFVLGQQ